MIYCRIEYYVDRSILEKGGTIMGFRDGGSGFGGIWIIIIILILLFAFWGWDESSSSTGL
jgi:hypothetical protein